MFIIIGVLIVTGSVIGGFIMAHGDLAVLMQVAEFVIIGGAALGSIIISAPLPVIKKLFGNIPKAMGYKSKSKEDYLELLKAFYDLFILAQRNGLLALEKHVENPEQSEIFSKNAKFLANKTAVSFVCDTLKVMLSGGIPPHEIEELMDVEIETFEAENAPAYQLLAKTGDAMPGLGIVAAVLGVIITMGSINEGAESVGKHVAAALVGTFLGILFSYGYMNPLATNIEMMYHSEVHYLTTIKSCIVSYAKGNPPIVAVEIARRTIESDERPSFGELESYLRGK